MNTTSQNKSVEASEEAVSVLGLKHRIALDEDVTAPLAFFVHGRAGTMEVMWPFQRCVPTPCSIIAPEAFLPDIKGGYSWWESGKNPYEQLPKVQERLGFFCDAAIEHYGLRPRKILCFGFSQGAGALSVLLLHDGLCFDGVALIAGFVLPPRSGAASKLCPCPVFIGHGTEDDVIPLSKAEEGASYLREQGYEVQVETDAVGHKIGAKTMRSLKEWSYDLLSQ